MICTHMTLEDSAGDRLVDVCLSENSWLIVKHGFDEHQDTSEVILSLSPEEVDRLRRFLNGD